MRDITQKRHKTKKNIKNMKSSSKSKYKATSGSINDKVLVKLSDRFKRNCLHEIDELFPNFSSEGRQDKRSKQVEFSVVMIRIYDDTDDDTDDEAINDKESKTDSKSDKVEDDDKPENENDDDKSKKEDEGSKPKNDDEGSKPKNDDEGSKTKNDDEGSKPKNGEDNIKNGMGDSKDEVDEDITGKEGMTEEKTDTGNNSGDDLNDEIKEAVKEGIKKNTFSPKNTPDDLTQPHEWKIPDDCNQLCRYMIKYCKDNYKIPPQSVFKIHVGKYMRLAPTKISPPDSSTLNRVIFNLNNDDVYRLEPGPTDFESVIKGLKDGKDKEEEDEINIPGLDMNKKLEPRTVFLEKGRCFPMGPFKQSNYEINLNPGSQIRVPPKINSKIKIRGQKTTHKLKPIHYSRVTIIVDTCVSSQMVEKITRETLKHVNKNKDMINDVRQKLNTSNLNINELMQDMSGNKQNNAPKKRRRRKRRKQNNDDDEELNDMMK